MIRLAAILAVAVFISFLGGTWLAIFLNRSDDRFTNCRETAVASGTDGIGGAFELLDAQGQVVSDEDVITKPSLLYFGYTFCPDVCPLDTLRNADAIDLLADQGYVANPIFISIDPNRDSPEVVGDFAARIHDRMIGLTGTVEQIEAVTSAYRTYHKAHKTDDDYYLVDHSTFSYLVLPEHGFVEFFRRNVPAEAVAERMACFIDRA
ncbi:MAG: SCO family protein [Aestuariivita sp.]|nr:SCO family protein [Aestuariivita sp.]MCY4203340.1 SCO family protein [Aestuariivita sp.]